MTLTPRGASDVLPTIDAFEKALSDYADAITNWSACTGGFVDAAEMRRHILESGALVMSMFTALTTRSAALEAEKAELIKALREWDTVEQFDRLLDSLPPEDEPEPPNIKIDDLCNSDISRSMPEQSTGSVASSPSTAPASAVDALGGAHE